LQCDIRPRYRCSCEFLIIIIIRSYRWFAQVGSYIGRSLYSLDALCLFWIKR
jgi:hypothetical protein